MRNEHIAKMVMSTINAKEATEKSAVGCLLLNGASHFNSGPFPIQSFFKGLRWADLTKDPTAPPSSSK